MQIADRLVCPACIGDAEVGVGLQDDLLARPAEVTDFRHACVIGLHPVDGLGLPRAV